MIKMIFPYLTTLSLLVCLLSGCAAVLPILPVMGTAYTGYVLWKSSEATKYYAVDLDTTYRAVMIASEQLQVKASVIKAMPGEGYSLTIKGPVAMSIDTSPLEKKRITKVVINTSAFGDKNYVEFFCKLVDENLPGKVAFGRADTQ
ncbi:MAG: hypothetical protein M0Q01_14955 [Syntrophales bacterium]|nr:hypothetical protein [Syntrophales bacterium]